MFDPPNRRDDAEQTTVKGQGEHGDSPEPKRGSR